MNFGIAIGAVDIIIKIALYYFYERIWYHFRFGVVTEKDKYNERSLFKKKTKIQEVKVPVEIDYKQN